jgi:trimeric autotransporter adhesin
MALALRAILPTARRWARGAARPLSAAALGALAPPPSPLAAVAAGLPRRAGSGGSSLPKQLRLFELPDPEARTGRLHAEFALLLQAKHIPTAYALHVL